MSLSTNPVFSCNSTNNKNVFITGINGFVGGNLAKLLLSKGANVYGLIKTYDHTSLIFYSNKRRIWI